MIVFVSRKAETDLEAVGDYIAKNNSSRAAAFVRELRKQCEGLADMPNDPAGRRIYGVDNAHHIRRQSEYNHRHTYRARKMLPYQYRGPVELLEDFYREAERIVRERGVR